MFDDLRLYSTAMHGSQSPGSSEDIEARQPMRSRSSGQSLRPGSVSEDLEVRKSIGSWSARQAIKASSASNDSESPCEEVCKLKRM